MHNNQSSSCIYQHCWWISLLVSFTLLAPWNAKLSLTFCFLLICSPCFSYIKISTWTEQHFLTQWVKHCCQFFLMLTSNLQFSFSDSKKNNWGAHVHTVKQEEDDFTTTTTTITEQNPAYLFLQNLTACIGHIQQKFNPWQKLYLRQAKFLKILKIKKKHFFKNCS